MVRRREGGASVNNVNGGRRSRARFGRGNGSIELVDGWTRCGARLERLGREGSRRVARGDRRGERRRLCSAWLVSSSSRKKKGSGNEVERREGISTSPRRVRGAIADAWRKLADDDSHRYGRRGDTVKSSAAQ